MNGLTLLTCYYEGCDKDAAITAAQSLGGPDMHDTASEPGFRENVDMMFSRAAGFLDLRPGLARKIQICNSTYTVRFGVRLRGKIEPSWGIARFIRNIWNR